MVRYKQKCMACKVQWALVTHYKQQPICDGCQKRFLSMTIDDPVMKKMFAIDPAFYEQSSFLRSIRMNYGRFGSLSEKQIFFFKKVVDELRQGTKQGVPSAPGHGRTETTESATESTKKMEGAQDGAVPNGSRSPRGKKTRKEKADKARASRPPG